MSDRDYYEVLGLTPRADGTMVDQAYWHLARKYQQLATTNARGRRLLEELNESYGVLGNPRLRKEYDAFRDDVLVAKGVIGPVLAKPKKRTKQPSQPPADEPRERRVTAPHLPNGWRILRRGRGHRGVRRDGCGRARRRSARIRRARGGDSRRRRTGCAYAGPHQHARAFDTVGAASGLLLPEAHLA